MPLRKEPPTPRSAAALSRLDPSPSASTSLSSSSSSLGPLIPLKPGQTSLRQQAILNEEEYTSALSNIIKRDFFPNLDRVTAENEYLAAVEADDSERIRRALDKLVRMEGGVPARKKRAVNVGSAPVRREEEGRGEWDDTPLAIGSSRVFNPTFTPATSTPGTAFDQEAGEENEEESGSGITPNSKLSLGAFQAQYTSEDNASFSQLLDRDNQVRKRKYAHLFAREQASEQQRKQITQTEQEDAEKGKRLAIEENPDHQKLLLEKKGPMLMIEGSSSEAKGKGKEVSVQKEKQNDLMEDLILVPEPRKDDRPPPAGLNRWKYTARNALMFGPDANTNPLRSTSTSHSPVLEGSEKPQTNFSAVRSLDDSHPSTSAGEVEGSDPSWSPSSSRVDAAIQRGRRWKGRADSFASSLDSAAMGAEDSPKVKGYGFVTPYSTPHHSTFEAGEGVGEGEDDMHLRIYNAIKARRRSDTTRPLTTTDQTIASDGGSGGRREFELPNPTRREQLAEKLASAASPKPRTAGGATPYGKAKYTGLGGLRERAFASPKFGGMGKKNAGALTPAARALLNRSTRGLTPLNSGFATPQTPALAAQGGGRKGVGDRSWTPTPQRHT